MNAIVMNTRTGAVSEYSGFDFQSITPTHAGSAVGLYELGGDTDNGAPIVGELRLARLLWGSSKKKFVAGVYFSMQGSGESECTLSGPAEAYSYAFVVRASGESRATPGRGFRENYFDVTYRNPDGAAFKIDQIEVMESQSNNRRV